jgi:hypothetical protein
MQSFLLSALTTRFKAGGLPAFQTAHPHQWLVWEPGPWLPSNPGATLVQPKRNDPQRSGSKERLCIQVKAVVGKPHLVLGRHESADVQVNDATLSRAHLALVPGANQSWSVLDLGSSNGSWLNGRKLLPNAPVPLTEGGQLQAGQVYLTFEENRGLWVRLNTSL